MPDSAVPFPDLAAVLREASAAQGVSQAELAKVTGRSTNAVNTWFAGRSRPKVEALPALAERLGVSVNDLLDKAGYGLRAPPSTTISVGPTEPTMTQAEFVAAVTELLAEAQRQAAALATPTERSE